MSMRRSKAFVLSEVLMTILLQAGFILVLCMSFYLFLDFYTRTQQILTARNHAERVIQFMDDKIRNAGLGLWNCKNPTTKVIDSATIRTRLGYIPLLSERSSGKNVRAYKSPISIIEYDGNDFDSLEIPQKLQPQDCGNVITLLYAQRDLSSGENETILTTYKAEKLSIEDSPFPDNTKLRADIALIGMTDENDENIERLKNQSHFAFDGSEANVNNYAVIEALGVPLYLHAISTTVVDNIDVTRIVTKIFGITEDAAGIIIVPAGSELMYLKCMQMFVHNPGDGNGRQFAFRELKSNGTGWDSKYNQEKGILEIYMTLDTDTNIFTLYVLGSGGEDSSASNPRPEAWPNNANPRPEGKSYDDDISDKEAATAWESSEYRHHVVYVARKSWKLNNIPEGFKWN